MQVSVEKVKAENKKAKSNNKPSLLNIAPLAGVIAQLMALRSVIQKLKPSNLFSFFKSNKSSSDAVKSKPSPRKPGSGRI